jgi:DNA processing protein
MSGGSQISFKCGGYSGLLKATTATLAAIAGADVVYPKENSRLVEQILSSGGAVIFEFPVSTSQRPKSFPFATASLAGYLSECWSLRPPNTAEHG